jgi:hypothetical protein
MRGTTCGVIAALFLVATERSAAQSVPDISGFWELSFDSRRVPAANLTQGVTPALMAKQGERDARAIRWCNFLGLPAAMDSPRPINLRQGRREIVINFETVATPRHLYFRSTHPNMEIFDPTTNGDSIARWEGDTLVVDTVGFDGDKGVTMIPGGGYRTAASRLIERYRLLNDGTVRSPATRSTRRGRHFLRNPPARPAPVPDSGVATEVAVGAGRPHLANVVLIALWTGATRLRDLSRNRRARRRWRRAERLAEICP